VKAIKSNVQEVKWNMDNERHCQAKPKKGRVTVVLDSQAGSCGKGKMVGYLALRDKPSVAINNFMTNAGHTFVYDSGVKVMTQHLPTSLVNPTTMLCIGPGAAITPQTLVDEIDKYKDLIGDRRIYIHPRAMVILPRHAEKERELLRYGSTFKGCGMAQAEKIMRIPGTTLFQDWYDDIAAGIANGDMINDKVKFAMTKIQVADTALIVNNAIDSGMDILVEGSQGCDLDINYGLEYPHCTSRQCHVGQLLADCGIAPSLVTDTIMIMRPYPIRISNQTNIGMEINSGGYCGSDEITWDEVRRRCGAPDGIEFGEMTTVTKKVRRVFEMNWDRLRYVTTINRPTKIALNFAQYLDWDIKDGQAERDITQKVWQFMCEVLIRTGVSVDFVGTGARNCDIIDRTGVK